jgi:peptidoglycan/LPS O-acetylase OafA/YrhL
LVDTHRDTSGIDAERAGRGWFARMIRAVHTWSTAERTYPLGYVPALDGARGIMTLCIFAAHTRIDLDPGAVVFMDVFFVMSGYLITSLLISDYRKRGVVDFRKFYVRRFLRLFPALTAMLAASLVVALLFSSDLRMRLIDDAVAFVYISNYWIAFDGIGLFYSIHTWSLSMEEQFYVLWPLAFSLLARRFGLSWTMVAAIMAVAIGVALWRAWLTYDGATLNRLHYGFDARADTLLIGCALAVALKLVDLGKLPRLSAALAFSQLPLTLVLAAASQFPLDEHRWYYYVGPFATALIGAIGIAATVQPRRNIMHRVFEYPVAVFLGRICYGLYIWHFPVFIVLRMDFHAPYIVIFLVGWPIAIGLAVASYYLIERHFMRIRPL